jgi:hypothetical protein
MSIWIHAFCTKRLDGLAAQQLGDVVANADFMTMAERHGLDAEDGSAAQQALRFEGPPGELETAQMYHRPENPDGLFIAVTRFRGNEGQDEGEARLARASCQTEDGLRRIRDVLARSVETISFCLKQHDADGMGWPIAWHLAMRLAEQGEGLMDADDEWWDPVTSKPL